MEVVKLGWPVKELIYVGAEAYVYRIDFLGRDAVLKLRIGKKYRVRALDEELRKKRTQTEAVLIHKAKKAGVRVPTLLFLDIEKCAIVTSYIEGKILRELIDTGQVDWVEVAERMGRDIARLHSADIVHGDLTTSNVFRLPSGDFVYFDFGLGELSGDADVKAVDLDLLYRVIRATRSDVADVFMERFLKSYVREHPDLRDVVREFEIIRRMGRYVPREERRRFIH